jgi:hypothetical protein
MVGSSREGRREGWERVGNSRKGRREGWKGYRIQGKRWDRKEIGVRQREEKEEQRWEYGSRIHCKKQINNFPSPAGMLQTKLSLAGII